MLIQVITLFFDAIKIYLFNFFSYISKWWITTYRDMKNRSLNASVLDDFLSSKYGDLLYLFTLKPNEVPRKYPENKKAHFWVGFNILIKQWILVGISDTKQIHNTLFFNIFKTFKSIWYTLWYKKPHAINNSIIRTLIKYNI